MFSITWILCLCFIATAIISSRIDKVNGSRRAATGQWAVLVAGSHRWMRYRHQANVCHAYKILRENGIPRQRIITFMYDDIANNPENPEPGVIRNVPNGTNVYEDVPIDYRGEDVRKEVFLNVLQGYRQKVKGIGSERVVFSTGRDNILIVYTGLGVEGGFLEFPDSGRDDLNGEELVSTFKKLHTRSAYNNILMYVESSHSGAVFDNNTLPNNLDVMAITAGGPDEDTWGTWCNIYIKPCLAGLFSYAWMSYVENSNNMLRKSQSVFNHFDHVRNEVSNTGQHHPQMYGQWDIGMLPISEFIGYKERDNYSPPPKIGRQDFASGNYDEFDKNTVTIANGVPVDNIKRNSMQAILNNIVELVIPDEHTRNSILNREPTDKYQNQCVDDLLSLFDEKCNIPQKDGFAKQRQEVDVLAKLCDVSVMYIQHMTAAEAIEKTCT